MPLIKQYHDNVGNFVLVWYWFKW